MKRMSVKHVDPLVEGRPIGCLTLTTNRRTVRDFSAHTALSSVGEVTNLGPDEVHERETCRPLSGRDLTSVKLLSGPFHDGRQFYYSALTGSDSPALVFSRSRAVPAHSPVIPISIYNLPHALCLTFQARVSGATYWVSDLDD
ncbi:hypothetical protein NDU88_004274 [Pleurodeles waltl]|uniref:Uncharacterized protein n=1 Tax=Pleurodeles waltl TaxID=8319 RepID=A0AAV7SIA5_PLEWA|nr:hypothetical protein NDU88_004274 [Pleurodeles waltl]